MRIPNPLEILEKIVCKLSPSQIVDLHHQKTFTGFDLYYLYKIAQKNGLDNLTATFLQDDKILVHFKFLGDPVKKWIKNKEFWKLDYPSITTRDMTFREVIEELTGDQFNIYVLKEFGALSLKYGTRPLNNWRAISFFHRDKEIKPSEFFKLDHSQIISGLDIHDSLILEAILSRYGLKRMVKILKSSQSDLTNLSSIVLKIGRHRMRHLLENLPRKPKGAAELTRYLEKELARFTPPEKCLEQLIAYWDGRAIGPYVVRVPNKVEQLTKSGAELSNCLESYIARILRKECQVLTLEKEGKLEVAVDLVPNAEGWSVRDILGVKNDRKLQGRQGMGIRKELQAWCGELPRQ